MNIKTKLSYLSFTIGLVIFSNIAVYAQYETAALFASDANRKSSSDFFRSSTSELSKYDFCLAMNYEHNIFLTDPNNPNKTKDFYLYKRKRQNTTGWVLLIGGTAMTVGGLIGFASNFELNFFNTGVDKDKETRAEIFAIVTLTGILADLISIPFFISAHHNKRMASSLSLGTQNTNFQQYNSICQYVQPAITFKVKF